jgi:hypothetical protein
MVSKPVGLAVLVVGLMSAAAGGAFVAMRQQSHATSATDTLMEPAALAAPAEATPSSAAPGPHAAAPPVAVETPAVTPAAAPAPRKKTAKRARIATGKERPVERSEAAPAADPAPVTTVPLPEPIAAAAPAEPPAPQTRFEEITIPSDTVIGVQVETTVSSERTRVEDRVEGRVTRDVTVDGRVAIPAGTRMIGSVTTVERGGKFKQRARVAVRFHTAQLPDGSRLDLETTAIMREGDSPSRESAAKVGGSAVGGAILGAILGGAKGAVIGGSAGAAGGTAVVMAGDRNAATLPAGTTVTVRLMSDVTVTVER